LEGELYGAKRRAQQENKKSLGATRKKESRAEAQRRREIKGIFFFAPLRLRVSPLILHFICIEFVKSTKLKSPGQAERFWTLRFPAR
jgi:hypothetical protein